jgi:hypothetical protein
VVRAALTDQLGDRAKSKPTATKTKLDTTKSKPSATKSKLGATKSKYNSDIF